MGFSGFLFVYLLGGLTFLPLVLITVLVHAYFTFPYREDTEFEKYSGEDDIVQPGDDVRLLKAAQKELKDDAKPRPSRPDTEVAAGYFAVCREYTPMGINAKPIERSTPVGSATVAAPSQSVYQTMYRSIFDRKQVPGPLDNKNISQRPKKAGNVFYVVLRHGHLMLFDDDEQLEVRHVISLAHHDVSIYSGGDTTPEGELFIKRNALCLSRRTEGLDLAPDRLLSKPFYLFSENCSAKEDFYFAMLRNQEQAFPTDGRAPAPLQFDVKHIISLVQKLHSSEEHLQSRWLNAMIGRVFLGIYKTPDLENFIREKLTKKISRVKRPTFLSSIEIRKIDTGEAAPYFTNLRHRDLTVEGECCIEADVKYTGNFRIEVAAVARIDLGARLKAREVNLVLSVALRKLDGHALFKIKAPPSNRVWFSFSQMPKIEMTIEPIVSSRQITYTVILRQIESRIKEVIAETLVLPFWDDSPFFSTSHKKWRGGIFAGDDAVETSEVAEKAAAEIGDLDDVDRLETSIGTGVTSLTSDVPAPTIEKSHSMPVLENAAPAGLFGRKLGSRSSKILSPGLSSPSANASSSSIDIKPETPAKQRPERSSSFVNEPAPTVGTETVNAEILKPSSPPGGESPAASAMAKLSSKSQTWSALEASAVHSLHAESIASNLPANSSASKSNTDKGIETDESSRYLPRRGTGSSTNSVKSEDKAGSNSPVPSIKASFKSHTGSLSRGFFVKKETSNTSLSPASTNNNGGSESPPKRNTLAAVSNVAGAAKRWGWNALQRNADGAKHGYSPESEPQVDLSKPMGGGRPLPPPGMPLPMPEKKTKTAPAVVPRRKPVAAPPMPDQTSTGVRDSDVKRRAVPPPPLPRRRQRAESADQQEDEDEMLVVAAPLTESEPTSPRVEVHEVCKEPWVEDVEDDQHEPVFGPLEDDSSHGDGGTPPALPSRPPEHPSGSLVKEQASPRVSAEDESDEYSAWTDNLGEDETGKNTISPEGLTQ